jgi:integrase
MQVPRGIKELTNKPHFVSLSRQAVTLLGDLKKLTGNRRYLFPGSHGGRPLGGQPVVDRTTSRFQYCRDRQ